VITIAVDAMGGDYAPAAVVQGAVDCARDPRCDFHLLLVGDEAVIRPLLPTPCPPAIAVFHASEIVGMKDPIGIAVKGKPDSSMRRGLELVRDGRAQGFISAGNTAADMALSTLILGRLPGVERPCIGTFLPSQKVWTLLIDAGANVDAKPKHLLQFAIMGSIFTELIRGIPRPTVGLLSVGEEDSKGNDAVIEAHGLLRAAPINFLGNVEGRDILKGTADVVVCDGFTGNILLKFAESFPGLLKHALLGYAARGLVQKLWAGLMGRTLKGVLRPWDYQEAGGVPLLGVRGVSIIGHGSSSPRAILNMILRAKEMAEHRVNERIAEAMSGASST
jgi:phosphate acyltransferase